MDNQNTEIIDELVLFGIYRDEHNNNPELAMKDLLRRYRQMASDERSSRKESEIRLATLLECKDIITNNHHLIAIPKLENLIKNIE